MPRTNDAPGTGEAWWTGGSALIAGAGPGEEELTNDEAPKKAK